MKLELKNLSKITVISSCQLDLIDLIKTIGYNEETYLYEKSIKVITPDAVFHNQFNYILNKIDKNKFNIIYCPEAFLSPVNCVELSKNIIDTYIEHGTKFLIFTYSYDITSSFKFISIKEKIKNEVVFYLINENKELTNCGFSIEEIIKTFNESFDIQEKYGEDE